MNWSGLRIIRQKTVYAVPIGIALASSCSTATLALGNDDQRVACAPDVLRLCSSEIPNVDHIVVCMTVKKASLSPACKAVFTTPETTPKKMRNPAGPVQR
jgi:hypothetical protein